MKSMLYVSTAFGNYKRKILGQLDGFRKFGLLTFLCSYDWEKGVYFLAKISESNIFEIKCECQGSWSRGAFAKFFSNIENKYKFQYYYFRRFGIGIIFLGRNIRKINKYDNRKVIYEMPTYPLDSSTFVSRVVCEIEKIYLQHAIFPYADSIPVFVRTKEYSLSEKMVVASNCVHAKEYLKYVNFPLPDYNGKELRFLAIAHTEYWHGYDRMMETIASWTKLPEIKFTVYGNYTQETKMLIELCENENIKNVEFLEEKDVDNFDEFICQYHIGVGCLALSRRNNSRKEKESIALDTSLKNKEYCAMGIPFIHTAEDISFSENLIFHLLLPDDETILDIEKIAVWYEEFRKKILDRKYMWEYAEKNLNYLSYAQKIIDSLD